MKKAVKYKIILPLTFVIMFPLILYIILSFTFYKKLYFNYSKNCIVIDNSILFSKVKDFDVDENRITSLSDDPRLELHFIEAKKYILLSINTIERESDAKDTAQIFYANDKEAFDYSKSLKFKLHEGKNIVELPSLNYEKLRIDLTSQNGVTIDISSVELTNNLVLCQENIKNFWKTYFNILVIIFLVVGISYLLWIMRAYIAIYYKKLSFILCFLIVYGGIIYTLFLQIEKKDFEAYTVYDKTFEEITTQKIFATYTLQIYENNIKKYRILFDKKTKFYGTGSIIFYQNETPIYFIEAIGMGKKIDFDFSSLPLQKGEIWKIKVLLEDDQIFTCYQDSGKRLKDTQIYSYEHKYILWGFIIINFFTVCVLLVITLRKNNGENSFIVISLILGLVFCFLNPPYSVADEFRHFIRAYSYAVGDWRIEDYKDNLPIYYLPQELAEIRDIGQENDYTYKRGEENRQINMRVWLAQWDKEVTNLFSPVCIVATADISPIAYLPQIIFIKLSTLLKLSPISTIYMARIGNLLTYSLAIGLSIKRIKNYKLILMGVGLIPLSIRFAASNSTDSFLLALTITYISLLLEFLNDDKKNIFTLFHFTVFSLLAIGIANIKLPYLLLLLSMLAINKKCFKDSYVHKIIFVFGVFLAGLVTYSCIQILIVAKSTAGNSSINELISNVLSTPVYSINTLISGFYSSYSFVTDKYGIGYLDVIYLVFMVYTAFYSLESDNITFTQKLSILIISLLTWCTVIGVFWIVGKGILITGMHGRYIFPILPFILLPFAHNHDPSLTTRLFKNCSLFQIIITGLYMINIFSNYYL